MTWSIRARLTAWYGLLLVVVLVAAAGAIVVVQDRLALERLDGELERLLLTLEGDPQSGIAIRTRWPIRRGVLA